MELLSFDQWSQRPRAEEVFRAKTRAWIAGAAFLIFFAGGVTSLYFAITESVIFYYFAVVSFLLSFFYSGPTRAALQKKTNWIVIADSSGLWIQLRSYLNRHFPSHRPSILRLDFSEMEWIRILKETRNVPSSKSRTQTSFHKILQIKVRLQPQDFDQIDAALKADSHERDQGSRFRYVHFPVALKKTASMIAVDWEAIGPSLKRITKILSQNLKILDLEKKSWGSWRNLSPEQTDDLVIELVQFGKDMDAIRLLREKNGLDLTQAKQFIEELRGKAS